MVKCLVGLSTNSVSRDPPRRRDQFHPAHPVHPGHLPRVRRQLQAFLHTLQGERLHARSAASARRSSRRRPATAAGSSPPSARDLKVVKPSPSASATCRWVAGLGARRPVSQALTVTVLPRPARQLPTCAVAGGQPRPQQVWAEPRRFRYTDPPASRPLLGVRW